MENYFEYDGKNYKNAKHVVRKQTAICDCQCKINKFKQYKK